MDYKKVYDNLIFTRKLLNRKKIEGVYYEKHHILPKSLGGSNNNDNLILLTPKEHLFAHLLLAKIHSDVNRTKMVAALWLMCNSRLQQKKISSCREYSFIRELWSKTKKGTINTKTNCNEIQKG